MATRQKPVGRIVWIRRRRALAAEAQERHFYAAPRRAFVADGSAYNWTIHRGYFGDFEPITDFLHAVCYVFSSAAAVSADEASGWSRYRAWMRACWQGRVVDVLTELDQWQARVGESPPGEAATAEERRDPRRVVAQARSYLGNNRDRMAYPRYRRAGLPTTSCLVESRVGEVNARVKGKQKHWNRLEGAESILQLRAAVLSQDDRLPGSSHNDRGARSANEIRSTTNQRTSRHKLRRDLGLVIIHFTAVLTFTIRQAYHEAGIRSQEPAPDV